MTRRRYGFPSDVGSARPAPDIDDPTCMGCLKRKPKTGPFCGRPCAVSWALAMTETMQWCRKCMTWREMPCGACGGGDAA